MLPTKIEMLTRTSVLWLLFVLCIVTLSATQYLAGFWEINLLDEIYNLDDVKNVLGEMSEEQKMAHIWITASLDLIYPIIFGGLLAGLTLRLLPKYGRYLIVPALVGVFFDLSENVVQVASLLGSTSILEAKMILTPGKMGLFLVAFVIVIIGVLKWLFSKIQRQPIEA